MSVSAIVPTPCLILPLSEGFKQAIYRCWRQPGEPLKRWFSDEEVTILARIAWWDRPIDAITEHVREIWTVTPAELEQTARNAGLLED